MESFTPYNKKNLYLCVIAMLHKQRSFACKQQNFGPNINYDARMTKTKYTLLEVKLGDKRLEREFLDLPKKKIYQGNPNWVCPFDTLSGAASLCRINRMGECTNQELADRFQEQERDKGMV